MKRTYEKELPADYTEVQVLDMRTDKKLIVWLNVFSMVAAVLIIAGGMIYLARKFEHIRSFIFSYRHFMFLLVSLFSYVILHELTHGVVYKLRTGHKLTFGFSFVAAWCGVPDIYVYRTTAMLSCAAPFVIFSIALALPFFLCTTVGWKMAFLILFAVHFGGCAGDLYDLFLYFTKYRNPVTLMRDTGPKQYFYLPRV